MGEGWEGEALAQSQAGSELVPSANPECVPVPAAHCGGWWAWEGRALWYRSSWNRKDGGRDGNQHLDQRCWVTPVWPAL